MRQRDPPIFSGSDEYSVEDWLSLYERVSAHNKWDDAQKLSYMNFHLTGVASVWYNNHESELHNWSDFKARSQVFNCPAVWKLCAEEHLHSHSQQPGESFANYIEDIVDLCKRVDPSMPVRRDPPHHERYWRRRILNAPLWMPADHRRSRWALPELWWTQAATSPYSMSFCPWGLCLKLSHCNLHRMPSRRNQEFHTCWSRPAAISADYCPRAHTIVDS